MRDRFSVRSGRPLLTTWEINKYPNGGFIGGFR